MKYLDYIVWLPPVDKMTNLQFALFRVTRRLILIHW
jgi:hypothetical protein